MMNKHFLSLQNLKSRDLEWVLQNARELKTDPWCRRDLLKDRSIGLVFQKPSNRTRVSFEVGIKQLGGYALYLGPEEINLGVRESTSDVAKTLSRYLDGIVARTFSHQDILDLARNASVPVINGLSDIFHPCQAVTDLMTILENFDRLKGLKAAYIGDGNNVCHSFMLACATAGIHLSVATPAGYEPQASITEEAREAARESGGSIAVGNQPRDAASQAHVIYTDVWISMGQEDETDRRLTDFHPFQINDDLLSDADKDYIFLHCLPAHRGQEVTEGVIDGSHSRVFDQAENRLHAQKAILLWIYS